MSAEAWVDFKWGTYPKYVIVFYGKSSLIILILE